MERSIESLQYVLEDLFGESATPITVEMLSSASVPLEYRQTISLIVDKLMFYIADLQAIAADNATIEMVSIMVPRAHSACIRQWVVWMNRLEKMKN